MLEPKEIKELNREKKVLAKCGGLCHDCESLHLYTCKTQRGIAYAWGCDKCPYFGAISESAKTMYKELLELIEYELS